MIPPGKYRALGVLPDANLLVGLLVGSLGPEYLVHCRATKNFSQSDYELLNRFLGRFERIVTTPHILTEVSNLSGRLPSRLHEPLRRTLRTLLERLDEQAEPASELSILPEFLKFGLTDTAISSLTRHGCLVLTDELPLAGFLQSRGVKVINFSHLRMEHWRREI